MRRIRRGGGMYHTASLCTKAVPTKINNADLAKFDAEYEAFIKAAKEAREAEATKVETVEEATNNPEVVEATATTVIDELPPVEDVKETVKKSSKKKVAAEPVVETEDAVEA